MLINSNAVRIIDSRGAKFNPLDKMIRLMSALVVLLSPTSDALVLIVTAPPPATGHPRRFSSCGSYIK